MGKQNTETAESVIYTLVVGMSAPVVERIAAAAMRDKEALFKESGWEVNHKITEGDVKCVLRSIASTAVELMKSSR